MSSLSDFTSKAENPHEVDLAPPSFYSRRVNSRRKGGVGGRKKKQMQAQERKYQAKSQELLGSLKPVPFAPNKILDFSKQENLLKRLGLWDFAHMQFDRDIRADFIAQLIVSYDSKARCGYVNGKRINANRADLARAFKLPVKKEKGASMAPASDPVDLDSELPGDDTLAFFDDFISNWILLHDDTWIMPPEVLNWTKLIKEGHLEKLDWAGMIWFMVEKELLEGVKLEHCYYSSHLQHLIKCQKEKLFLSESEDGDEEEAEVKEEEVKEEREEATEEGEDIKEEVEEEVDEVKTDKDEKEQANTWMEEPNVELTLGQDNVEREENKDDEKEEKENNDDEMEEKENKDDRMEENVQGRWLSDGKNDMAEHFLQRCNMDVDRGMDSIVWKEEEEYEEEEEEEHYEEVKEDFEKEGIEADDDNEEEYDEKFSDPSSDDDPLGNQENLLQGLDTAQLPFVGALGQLDDHSNMELFAPPPSSSRAHPLSMGPNSVFGNNRKREIAHELDIANDGSNKRLRNDDNSQWLGGHHQHQLHQQTSGDLGMCLDQLQHMIGKAKIMYEEKEQASEQSNVNEQFLVSELQNRDQIIEHLQRTKAEEIQKKESEIYRMEREMCIMSNLVEGYRKALKETQKEFAQYRKRNQLLEEQIYRDAGPGGLVLSTMEMEKIRLREEEENRVKRTMFEHQFNEITQVAISGLELHFNQLQILDNRLAGIENAVNLLKDFCAKNKERGMEKEEEQGHEMEIEHGQGDDEEEQVDNEEDKKKEDGNDDEEEEVKKEKEHEDEEEQKKKDEDEEQKKKDEDEDV